MTVVGRLCIFPIVMPDGCHAWLFTMPSVRRELPQRHPCRCIVHASELLIVLTAAHLLSAAIVLVCGTCAVLPTLQTQLIWTNSEYLDVINLHIFRKTFPETNGFCQIKIEQLVRISSENVHKVR